MLQYVHDFYNQATTLKEKAQHTYVMIPARFLTSSSNIGLVNAVIADFITNTSDEFMEEAIRKFGNGAFDNYVGTSVISRVVERPEAYETVKGLINADHEVGLLNALFAKLPQISSPDNAQAMLNLAGQVLKQHAQEQGLITELLTALSNEVDRNTDYVDDFRKQRGNVLSREQRAQLATLVEAKRQKDREAQEQAEEQPAEA